MAIMQSNRKHLSFEARRRVQSKKLEVYLRHHDIKNHKCNWTKLDTYLGNIRGDKAKILDSKFLNNTLIRHGNKGQEPHNKTPVKKWIILLKNMNNF